MAEEVGFEPTVARATTVFKTATFVHSVTPPDYHVLSYTTPLECLLSRSALRMGLLPIGYNLPRALARYTLASIFVT